jgi:hypothetical protein
MARWQSLSAKKYFADKIQEYIFAPSLKTSRVSDG